MEQASCGEDQRGFWRRWRMGVGDGSSFPWWQLPVHPSWYFQVASVLDWLSFQSDQESTFSGGKRTKYNFSVWSHNSNNYSNKFCKGYPHKEMWVKINILGIREHNEVEFPKGFDGSQPKALKLIFFILKSHLSSCPGLASPHSFLVMNLKHTPFIHRFWKK